MTSELLKTAPFTAEFRAWVAGDVLLPGDAAYETARLGFNLSVQQHPAVIVLAENVADVAAAVTFARRAGLPVSVQGTGHGTVRAANDSVLIVTSRMNDIQVDADAQTATVGAGAVWGQVLEKAQAVGLAPLLGSSPTVGVVGYSLGGGFGWLGRKYGLAADSLLDIELVNAQGEIIRTSATENADLFWGLRGGSGAFGAVTRLTMKLYPVTQVFGGNMLYPVEMAREVYAFFRAWVADAPDELTSSIATMNFPPMPTVPEPIRGKSFVNVRAVYSGPVEEGAALIGQWEQWRAPAINGMRPMSFSDVATVSSDPTTPVPSLGSGGYVTDLSDEAINTILNYALPQGGPPKLVSVEVRHFGGAIARVSADSNAFSHRNAPFVMHMVGITPTAEAHEAVAGHIAAFKSALGPHLMDGVYINFLDSQESRERTPDAYGPGKFERLQALKAKYDPENLFRSGFDLRA